MNDNDSDTTAATAASGNGARGITAWVDKHRNAILTGVISTLMAAMIFTLVDDVLEDKSLATRMDVAEARADEDRRAAAEFRREARQEWQKAEDRAVEDRREGAARAREAEARAVEDRREGAARAREAEARAADALEKAEARAAEDRREAAARAADALKKAEARAAEDRREARQYFRQINELLLGISRQGVENSARLNYLEGLRTQEE